jgi:uncharacterized protein YijF (DUF1287 family)
MMPILSVGQTFYDSLAWAAHQRTQHEVVYDPTYYAMGYPNGDVPQDKGVCTDVIIRSYRVLGIDLQKEVHEDMKANFKLYPKRWGLSTTDKNIDHRRVPNLQTYFSRHGRVLGVSSKGSDYQAGDIVTWDLGGGVTHIGIVSAKLSANGKRPLIVHNIGAGPKLEDMLFDYVLTGHYRYQ